MLLTGLLVTLAVAAPALPAPGQAAIEGAVNTTALKKGSAFYNI